VARAAGGTAPWLRRKQQQVETAEPHPRRTVCACLLAVNANNLLCASMQALPGSNWYSVSMPWPSRCPKGTCHGRSRGRRPAGLNPGVTLRRQAELDAAAPRELLRACDRKAAGLPARSCAWGASPRRSSHAGWVSRPLQVQQPPLDSRSRPRRAHLAGYEGVQVGYLAHVWTLAPALGDRILGERFRRCMSAHARAARAARIKACSRCACAVQPLHCDPAASAALQSYRGFPCSL
jgi:hypothetical protein